MSFWSKVKKFPWKKVLLLGLPLLKSRINNRKVDSAIDLLGPILLSQHGPEAKAKAMAIIDEHDVRPIGLDEQARLARERAT